MQTKVVQPREALPKNKQGNRHTTMPAQHCGKGSSTQFKGFLTHRASTSEGSHGLYGQTGLLFPIQSQATCEKEHGFEARWIKPNSPEYEGGGRVTQRQARLTPGYKHLCVDPEWTDEPFLADTVPEAQPWGADRAEKIISKARLAPKPTSEQFSRRSSCLLDGVSGSSVSSPGSRACTRQAGFDHRNELLEYLRATEQKEIRIKDICSKMKHCISP
ncbi:hypothetical protein DV515_00008362 [Chloebia gouldiae]|uniref:Uncharacterized protein n=1 Tax=Chloebia gouldiae TaxID=44316 RepID=A0A3L8SG67_CHLGU|nr:hypothetical protein DV515_00008362 [Chloebia gouldiae]